MSEILLGIRNYSVINDNPREDLLKNVYGYVPAGGMCAVLGPSSAGKTLLMKSLIGRATNVVTEGCVSLYGKPLKNNFLGHHATLEQDVLIGDLTVKESVEAAIRLRRSLGRQESETHVQKIIDELGLGHVTNNVIGTVLKRGLSGGEKRRASMSIELVAPSTVLFIDEATSGLDSSAALNLVEYMKKIAQESDGKLGVLISLQQPNLDILKVFDQLMLLGPDGLVFFGTLDEAKEHFSSLGYPPPPSETPTDFYLQLTDVNFSHPMLKEKGKVDFVQLFKDSNYFAALKQKIEQHCSGQTESTHSKEVTNSPEYQTSSLQQFRVLLRRNLTVAYRDITLYYLQLFLHSFYGFLVGAVWYQIGYSTGDKLNDAFSAVTWLMYIQTYIQVFKTHYLMVTNKMYAHEHSNYSYRAFPYWAAELISAMVGTLAFMPGVVIFYFMVGFPIEAFAYTLLVTYILAFAAEGTVHLCCHVSTVPAFAVVLAQSVMIILSVFAFGSVITEGEVPPYFVWAQELSFYTQAGRGLGAAIFSHITYDCTTTINAGGGGSCSIPLLGLTFPCSESFTGATCEIRGVDVLETYKYPAVTNKWEAFAYLLILTIFIRLMGLLFEVYPLEVWKDAIDRRWPDWLHLPGVLHRKKKVIVDDSADDDDSNRAPLAQTAVDIDTASSGENDNTKGSMLCWNNLSVTLPKGKVLIDKIGGCARGGKVLALMGPSGAGKTTLLNALSARATYANVTGHVAFNGRNLTKEDLKFVPQFDNLNEFFSVEEQFRNNGQLQTNLTASEMDRRVQDLLHILGLTGVAKLRPNDLTHGQRKRVSIGLGLISQPKILFLDEPTTGLDSSAAYSIVTYISKVAHTMGVVVIMTIHQPSGAVFNSLDDLFLMEKGRLVYFGKLDAAKEFFTRLGFACGEGVNPADYYLNCVSHSPHDAYATYGNGPKPDELKENTRWEELYKKFASEDATPQAKDMKKEAHQSSTPNEATRFFLLLRQYLVYNMRDPIYFLRAAQLFAMGLFLGLLYVQLDHSTSVLTELSGSSFWNIWVVLFSVTASAPSFAISRRQVQEQYVNGSFKLWTFAAAQFISTFPYALVAAFAFQIVNHWIIGFNNTAEAFFYALINTALLLLLMEGITLSVVEGLKDPMLSVTFSMILLGMLFLFAGFFVHVEYIPDSVSWISYIIPSKNALDGGLNNVFSGQEYDIPGGGQVSGDALLTGVFGHDSSTLGKWVNLLVVLAWTIAYRLIHLGLMLYTNRNFGRFTLAGKSNKKVKETNL